MIVESIQLTLEFFNNPKLKSAGLATTTGLAGVGVGYKHGVNQDPNKSIDIGTKLGHGVGYAHGAAVSIPKSIGIGDKIGYLRGIVSKHINKDY